MSESLARWIDAGAGTSPVIRLAEEVQSVGTHQGSGEVDPWPTVELEHLRQLIVDEPVEDGIAHPGERELTHLLEKYGETAGSWVRVLVFEGPAARGADIVRLLARLHDPISSFWRTRVVSDALASPTPCLRDAALQAAEVWRDPEIDLVLQQHKEPVAWLRDYAQRVMRDRQGR